MDQSEIRIGTPRGHSRKVSAEERRVPRPRSSTKGPLDAIDTSQESAPPSSPGPMSVQADNSPLLAAPLPDFSFLLRPPSIYHPLSTLDLPPAFRTHTPLHQSAISASAALTSTDPPATPRAILSHFYVRLRALVLLSQTALAAQESTALQDLSAPLYRPLPLTPSSSDLSDNVHLAPWGLRVLAVRLQAHGFADPRRCLEGYYALSREARRCAARASSKAKKRQWRIRLADLGIRCAAALVDMGDLAGAARFLEDNKTATAIPRRNHDDDDDDDDASEMNFEDVYGETMLKSRLALVYLQIGDVKSARRCSSSSSAGENITKDSAFSSQVLNALCAMAEGRYDEAADAWRALQAKGINNSSSNDDDVDENDNENDDDNDNSRLTAPETMVVVVNLAARALLEQAVQDGKVNAFHALTFNLCTIYELCSENAKTLKLQLAETVAAQRSALDADQGGVEMANRDFKL
ncbi:MAG: hypothetical protein M1825_005969 [Sarcosagium campestre]|nr:MAG: hypothetical protein M1825_005969 [Sarcosagium campestre]